MDGWLQSVQLRIYSRGQPGLAFVLQLLDCCPDRLTTADHHQAQLCACCSLTNLLQTADHWHGRGLWAYSVEGFQSNVSHLFLTLDFFLSPLILFDLAFNLFDLSFDSLFWFLRILFRNMPNSLIFLCCFQAKLCFYIDPFTWAGALPQLSSPQ